MRDIMNLARGNPDNRGRNKNIPVVPQRLVASIQGTPLVRPAPES